MSGNKELNTDITITDSEIVCEPSSEELTEILEILEYDRSVAESAIEHFIYEATENYDISYYGGSSGLSKHGFLTEAPGFIGPDVIFYGEDDPSWIAIDEDVAVHKDAKVYAFMKYQITSLAEEAAYNGEVVFPCTGYYFED